VSTARVATTQHPGAGGRRERRREEVRTRILEAALDLFAAHGYQATSVDQIADHADLARRTVFNHFPRKRDMLTVWADQRRALTAAVIDDEQVRQESARRQLELQFEALARANEQHPEMARVISSGWLAELGTLASPFPVFGSFTESVRVGQERGELRDAVPPQVVAEVLTACYADTLHRWLHDEIHAAHTRLLPALQAKLDLVLDGLHAAPEAERRSTT
jgi:AcrR family transcriptional regulator